jgi:hypothetical protein
MGKYIVISSSAKMPSSCRGRYRRVGVVELEPGVEEPPTMLSSRSRQVKRVVETWERLNVGTTERCAYQRAMREAGALATKLNKGT